MQITITLTDPELRFLQIMIDEQKNLAGKEWSLEESIHECMRMAMYDESEESAGEGT